MLCKYNLFSIAIMFYVVSDTVTEVKTNIYVTSFGPVSDTDMVGDALLHPSFLRVRDALS